MRELSLILPVLNEADFIDRVVDDVLHVLGKSGIDFELILAENGSTDRSLEVLKKISSKNERVQVCVAPHKGWGIALLTGFKIAEGEYIGHMPSDGQIDPGVIPGIWRRCKADTIAKVHRVERENFLRVVNSKVYNLLANILFGVRTFDINGCPKIYPRGMVEQMKLVSRDSFIDLEMMIKARKWGYKIREVSTISHMRVGGKSNTNWRTVIEFLKNMFNYKFGKSLR